LCDEVVGVMSDMRATVERQFGVVKGGAGP
jgi:hypothetical protein